MKTEPPTSERPLAARVAYPDVFRNDEATLIARRRAACAEGGKTEDREIVGVGLSGGGVRSATFCLGFFQGLAAAGLLPRIDLLSTVSGGGYFGSFFCRLFTRPYVEKPADVEQVLLGKTRSDVLRNLRENGRYLAPNGAGDLLAAGAAMLRNWVSLHLVLLCATITPFVAMIALTRLVEPVMGFTWDVVAENVASKLGLGFLASPWCAPAVLLFGVGVAPLGAAYWFIDTRRAFGAGAAVVVVALTTATGYLCSHKNVATPLAIGLALAAIATTLWYRRAYSAVHAAERVEPDRALRRVLTDWLSKALAAFVILGALAFVDTVGGAIYRIAADAGFKGLVSSAAAAVGAFVGAAAFGQKLLLLLGGDESGRLKVSASVILWIVAIVVGGSLLIGADALAHALCDRFRSPIEHPGWNRMWPSLAATALFLVLDWFFATNRAFPNRSSHHGLYASRVTRAYLGASNPQRLGRDARKLTEVASGDDANPHVYWRRTTNEHPRKSTEGVEVDSGRSPYDRGAPLHFVNVTVNETVDGRSQVQQQDRKGLSLAVGPSGYSLGVRHHAKVEWDPGDAPRRLNKDGRATDSGAERLLDDATVDEVFPDDESRRVFVKDARPETMSIGYWIGTSGAAFSTGLGARTSLGLSLLLGLANIRLGYWWRPGGMSQSRIKSALARNLLRFFPVQALLLAEFTARFPGTAWSRWYLSDGGHFENMGGYELIRRRVRRVLIVDAEQDATYSFEGLANLVRKARVDFGASIEFLSEEELDARVALSLRPLFGTLEQLRRGSWTTQPGNPTSSPRPNTVFDEARLDRRSRARCALARVRYADEPADAPEGLLLYVKPTLLGDEPADVLEYHEKHPEFPHESTADQFFDEEQWESYRALGEHVARTLFTPRASRAEEVRNRFAPADLFDSERAS